MPNGKINVNSMVEAIETAKRVQKLLAKESSHALADIIADRGDARDASPEGQAFERGYMAGMNACCKVANITVEDLDANEVAVAVYGSF